MGRARASLSKLTFGPPGICDACGKRCITMDQVGIVCYHCFQGVFMHRSWWIYSSCPACGLIAWCDCEVCRGTGVVATPREDIRPEDLRAAWRALPERYLPFAHIEPVPAVILERVRWADLDEALTAPEA